MGQELLESLSLTGVDPSALPPTEQQSLLGGIQRRLSGLLDVEQNWYSPETRQAMAHQAQMDAAPVGSINAPGGINLPPKHYGPTGDPTQRLFDAAAMLPGGPGDILGPVADARRFATDPESRTPGNFLLSGLGLLPIIPSITAFHGSPFKFDSFDMGRIGTGEGAQAYGHGLYYAQRDEVGEFYKEMGKSRKILFKGDEVADATRGSMDYAKKGDSNAIDAFAFAGGDVDGATSLLESQKANAVPNSSMWHDAQRSIDWLRDNARDLEMKDAGYLYTVDLPDDQVAKMLDWDAPLSEQPESVLDALKEYGIDPETWESAHARRYGKKRLNYTGGELLATLEQQMGSRAAASRELANAGIPGIKYYDGGSRAAGEGTRNFVVFDDQIPKILERNGEPVNALAASWRGVPKTTRVDDWNIDFDDPPSWHKGEVFDEDHPKWQEVELNDGRIFRSNEDAYGNYVWEVKSDGSEVPIDWAHSASEAAEMETISAMESIAAKQRDQIAATIPDDMDLSRSGARGEYFNVEDIDGDLVSIRVLKNHEQKAGGGFNAGTGESYGDADIDIFYDIDGGIHVENDYAGNDARISKIIDSITNR